MILTRKKKNKILTRKKSITQWSMLNKLCPLCKSHLKINFVNFKTECSYIKCQFKG